jgi:hypothetical protein
VGILAADALGGGEAFVGVGGWHLDVDDSDVRCEVAYLVEELLGVLGLCDDVDTGVGQQSNDARSTTPLPPYTSTSASSAASQSGPPSGSSRTASWLAHCGRRRCRRRRGCVSGTVSSSPHPTDAARARSTTLTTTHLMCVHDIEASCR